MPSLDDWLARDRAAGWSEPDHLHVELLYYERARAALGDTAVEGDAGPIVEWPAEWGRWSLAEHRQEIAHHRAEQARIAAEEARAAFRR